VHANGQYHRQEDASGSARRNTSKPRPKWRRCFADLPEALEKHVRIAPGAGFGAVGHTRDRSASGSAMKAGPRCEDLKYRRRRGWKVGLKAAGKL